MALMADAATRWRNALEAWAVPDEILARAPESPWSFPPALFRAGHHPHDHGDTPSHRRALDALPDGGSVLDVGVGGGAGSLPLAVRAAHITGVDQSEDMLAAFAEAAGAAGVSHAEVHGSWPEAAVVAPQDVVVCHHVFYNAPRLDAFARALTKAARRRVVAELTAVHPASTLNDLWMHFHGLARPEGPTYEDAVAVLREAGLQPEVEVWHRPPRRHAAPRTELVAFVRRRLCLPAELDPEIDELLGDEPVWSPQEIATLWWDGDA
jgi:SAM-dependent methyltransferase